MTGRRVNMSRAPGLAVLILGSGLLVCPRLGAAQSGAGTCEWTITASPPVDMVSTGSDATFMLIGNATMVMLLGADATVSGGGTITASDVTSTGTYDVGEAQGLKSQGAVLTIENQRGELLGLGTASGRQGFPPTAKLEVTHYSAVEIHGELKGTFWVMGYSKYGPPQMTHVPVEVAFKAHSSTSSSGCQ